MLVLVWKRADLRESSRLVTFLSAERGRFTALAKGAHRGNSATLGKLDFLNRCEITLSGRGFPLLSRIALVHEPRALRSPPRFLWAMHFAELFDAALLPDHPDRELFELALGTFTLVERSEPRRLPVVAAAVELRLLRALGLLPEFGVCSACGAALSAAQPAFTARREAGLLCERHRGEGALTVALPVRAWLPRLVAAKGRELPALELGPALGPILALAGRWVEAGLERRLQYRALALANQDADFPSTDASAGMRR